MSEPASYKTPHLILKLVLGIPITIAFFWGFLWAGGGLGWTRGWGLLGVMFVGETLRAVYTARAQPEMAKRRGEVGEGTPTWDKLWLTVFSLVIGAVFVVAALDGGRYQWAPLPAWWFGPGLVAYVLYLFGLGWAMAQNPHFEKSVRVQSDRGHRVIDTGPYAWIRHPGYLATFFGFGLAPPLMLGSGWGLVVALALLIWLIVRTALEDRFLQRELPGYADYAQRVRYRLFPGIW
ncbi:MAG: isoprenylcysteine carboxylmethyltransferase family protein [Alphaproteobacteria bacterium]|nr:isoprenylcysteine carboxylmethyltransferase family protein [Alphaproteobacteria bacterium]